MLEQIVDLHIHSKYSRACSPALELPNIAAECARKGIDIVSTGDFTHPGWFKHLEENLVEENEGVYGLSPQSSVHSAQSKTGSTQSLLEEGREMLATSVTSPARPSRGDLRPVKFILGTEVACIYKHKEKTRRLHLLLLAPNLEAVRKLNAALEAKKVNLKSDGRPIMGLSGKNLLQLMLEIDPRFMMIPAHAWTPWFAVFGSKSGYDSLEDCFEELTPQIRAIETGLSSDPVMNRRLSQLDGITLVSNSDAHGLENLGREANVLAFENEKEITYSEITRIIKEGDKKKFLYTIEFYPEEGKYHLDGHRECDVCLSPQESKRLGDRCPKCRRELTIGVLHRVDDLADRSAKDIPVDRFIPHRYIVPLREIIGAVFAVGVASKRVAAEYTRLRAALGTDFGILLKRPAVEINAATSDERIAQAIENTRAGKVKVSGGYDGVYGKVDLLGGLEKSKTEQSRLF